MPKPPPPNPYDLWPTREQYRTNRPDPDRDKPIPICSTCGARHRGATWNCKLENDHG